MELPQGKLKLKAYVKVDANPPESYSGCIPVMVGITPMPGTEEKRAPVNIVVVLHVHKHCIVPRNWRELLIEAMDVIVKKLGDKDRIAVLPVQSTLTTGQHVAHAKLLDDPYKIISNQSLVAALESANSILYGRNDEDKEWRAGHIIVISNSNEGTGSLLAWRFRSVHAFGFRDVHNARTMHSICRNRGCTYSVLDDEQGQITKAFHASIDRITTSAVVAMPIEIKLKCDQTVVLSAIDTPGVSYYISQDKKTGIIWPSAHIVEVPTNILVYLSRQQQDDLTKLFTVHVKYGNVSDKLDLQVVDKGTGGSKEVAAEIVRSEAIKIVSDTIAVDENDWEQLQAARDNLRKRWTKLESSDCGREAEHGPMSKISEEMREMEIRLYNNYFWLEYMLSWLSHQRWQLHLPQLLMYNKSTEDTLMPLRILAKVNVIPGTTTGHQRRVPVRVQIKAPEAGLTKVKRASVDMVAVLDASCGVNQMEQKTQERLKLLIKAKEVKKEHHKAKEMFDKLQKRQKLLDKSKDENSLQKQEMKDQITEKRREMNSIADEMNDLDDQIKETEEDLETVIGDTQQWLQLLKKAMDLVMKKLSDKDRLAIIPVQFSVPEPAASLLNMSKQTRSKISTTVKFLAERIVQKLTTANVATQTSHWRERLKKAKKLVQNCLQIATKSSSSNPTHDQSQGMTSVTGHSAYVAGSTELGKALMDAAKILDDRRGEEKDRMACIILISDSDDDSICKEALEANYIVLAFGILGTPNARALHHIVSSSNGIYGILSDKSNQLTEDFDCINNITSIIAVDAKIELLCSHSSSAVLSSIESGHFRHFIGDDRKSSSILVDVLYAATEMEFNVFVDNVREEDIDSLQELLTVRVKWLHPVSRVEEKLEGQVVVVKNGADFDRDKEVSKDIAHATAIKIATEITAHTYS